MSNILKFVETNDLYGYVYTFACYGILSLMKDIMNIILYSVEENVSKCETESNSENEIENETESSSGSESDDPSFILPKMHNMVLRKRKSI